MAVHFFYNLVHLKIYLQENFKKDIAYYSKIGREKCIVCRCCSGCAWQISCCPSLLLRVLGRTSEMPTEMQKVNKKYSKMFRTEENYKLLELAQVVTKIKHSPIADLRSEKCSVIFGESSGSVHVLLPLRSVSENKHATCTQKWIEFGNIFKKQEEQILKVRYGSKDLRT